MVLLIKVFLSKWLLLIPYKNKSTYSVRKKNGTYGGIPPKCLKLAVNESPPIITPTGNEEVVSSSMVPESLKLADVTPVSKKSELTLVSN